MLRVVAIGGTVQEVVYLQCADKSTTPPTGDTDLLHTVKRYGFPQRHHRLDGGSSCCAPAVNKSVCGVRSACYRQAWRP